jgi:hypothetical protein
MSDWPTEGRIVREVFLDLKEEGSFGTIRIGISSSQKETHM